MNNSRLFKKTIIAVTVALASGQAMAAGFQLNAQSATGLGRAFAGDAVIADNAAAMARNPATMALFDETSMSLGFVSITSMIEVKDATYTNVNGSQISSNYDDAGATSVAPNLHVIVPVNDKFAWGVNAYSNFGTRTEFGDSFVGSEYGGETEILSMNFGVAGSYRINNQWSLGGGLDLIYGQGTLKRSLSNSFYDGDVYPATVDGGMTSYLDSQNGTSRLDVDAASGWASASTWVRSTSLTKTTGLASHTVIALKSRRRMAIRKSLYHYPIWPSSPVTTASRTQNSLYTTAYSGLDGKYLTI